MQEETPHNMAHFLYKLASAIKRVEVSTFNLSVIKCSHQINTSTCQKAKCYCSMCNHV